MKIALAVAVAIGGLTASVAASAHWRGTVGIWIGPGPFWWGAPYYPYYYPPYVVADPVYAPPSAVTQVPAAPAYWYYCTESNTYYPYVTQCPSGWQQVTPQPPAPPAMAPR